MGWALAAAYGSPNTRLTCSCGVFLVSACPELLWTEERSAHQFQLEMQVALTYVGSDLRVSSSQEQEAEVARHCHQHSYLPYTYLPYSCAILSTVTHKAPRCGQLCPVLRTSVYSPPGSKPAPCEAI